MLKAFRIAASLLVVTLLIGMATDGVHAGMLKTAPVVSMAGEGGMPDCDGCGGDDRSAAVCAVYCSSNCVSAMALPPVLADTVHPDPLASDYTVVRVPAGLWAQPDPFPPRLLVLS